MAFIVHQSAVTRIGKPNPSVGMDDNVVGGVENLAFPLVRQHGDFAVVLIANHAAVAMLAR